MRGIEKGEEKEGESSSNHGPDEASFSHLLAAGLSTLSASVE